MTILSRLAALHQPRTKTQATELIRHARSQGVSLPPGRVPELAEALHTESMRQSAVRAKRVRPANCTRTLAERKAALRQRTLDAVAAAKRGLYRVTQSRWAGGDHADKISVGTDASCAGDSSRAWSSNGKWSGRDSEHRITVKSTWRRDVESRGLAVADGMLTLDAEPILGHGPELFRAAWVQQGKGFELNLARGYIARVGQHTYHAPSARAALDGVQRKAGMKPARRVGVVDLEKIARRYGDLPVTFADATAVGACESGAISWCRAVGIDPFGTATLADVVRGYKLRPMQEALRVIRRAVRDRHNRQPLDLSGMNGAAKLVQDGNVVFDSEGGFRIEPSAN